MLLLKMLCGLCCCPSHEKPLRIVTVSKIFGRVTGGSVVVVVGVVDAVEVEVTPREKYDAYQ